MALLWFLDLLVYNRKSFKNLEPPRYMTTCVRDLNTKFSDDPTDPAQLITCRRRFLWCHMMPHFFAFLKDGKVFCCGQAQLCQVWSSRCKKGFQISKRIFMAGFKKVLVVITFSLLETRTKFSEWPRVFTWQHWLISLIWPQENISMKVKFRGISARLILQSIQILLMLTVL